MRRVLIPLDGGSTATEIFSDAIRVAGPNGELLLMHVVSSPMIDTGTGGYTGRTAMQGSEQYLQSQAEPLRSEGATVRTISVVAQNISAAIEEAVVEHSVDLIACTTHGRTPAGRLAHGAVVWRLLAHATVPLLIRHVDDRTVTVPSGSRRILVPLDGSAYAEKALPLARELALEWNASLVLTRIVPDMFAYSVPNMSGGLTPIYQVGEEIRAAEAYLKQVAAGLPGEVITHVEVGQPVDRLTDVLDSAGATDVVMASHGRTGLPRVILGSVADGLMHQMSCPLLIIPALALGRLEDHNQETGVGEGNQVLSTN